MSCEYGRAGDDVVVDIDDQRYNDDDDDGDFADAGEE